MLTRMRAHTCRLLGLLGDHDSLLALLLNHTEGGR